jgi:hypothetical protein
MWRSVVAIAPKALLFLVILIVGWIVARLIGKGVDKILERVGFDRAVERGGIRKALERSNYDASALLGKIVYYALLLFVLQLAFGVFGPNPVSALLTAVIAFLPRLFVALVIVVVAAAIAAGVRDILSNALSGLSYGRMLSNIVSVFIIGLGVIAALNQMGIAVTVTLPVLVAVLATLGGILVVGVGGGLVRPMQSRWENYLSSAEREGRELRARRFPNYAAPAGGVGSAGTGSPATVYYPDPSTPTTATTPTTEQPQHWETGSTPEGGVGYAEPPAADPRQRRTG